jgi:hypothetical protein
VESVAGLQICLIRLGLHVDVDIGIFQSACVRQHDEGLGMARTERSETYNCMLAQPLVPAQSVSVTEGTVPYPSAPPWVLFFVDVGSHTVIVCLAVSVLCWDQQCCACRALLQ